MGEEEEAGRLGVGKNSTLSGGGSCGSSALVQHHLTGGVPIASRPISAENFGMETNQRQLTESRSEQPPQLGQSGRSGSMEFSRL